MAAPDPQAGLSGAQAALNLGRYGPNRLQPARQRAVLLQFLAHLRNPLVLVLLAASALSALTGDTTGAVIIALIVLMSVTLDFVQEYRAGQSAEQLALKVALTATVLRDGAPRELAVTELVPGDVVLLSAGNLVPADARVLQADDFFVNQAQLTGEPYPVEKHATKVTPEAAPPTGAPGWELDAEDAVFMGSSVVSGSARVLVGRSGDATALGQVAASLALPAPPTAFETGTRQFGMLIMRLTLMLVLFTLLVNVAFHRPLLESFLFAVALAVGLTPELLPMVVSVTLTHGALRMAALQVIVKRPSAIQDMGAMDVLCTDKTGTLTEARIRLERHVDARGRDSAHVLELAYLNSSMESGLKSPLDDAILAHTTIDVSAWKKIDEVPFDFERRRVSVLAERDGARRLVVKGAPEDILRLCTRYENGALAVVALDAAARTTIDQLFEGLGRQGFRVLGIAWRDVPMEHPHAVVTDETGLVFAGFCAFLDPPKASAALALAALRDSGVKVKIVTGDNELVTRHVCTELGVVVEGVLSGTDIAAMNDDALRARVEGTNLFCRVNPAQKNRVILALKARGHVVGYLGDGINDAPSLHSADVGISVAGAVDVAKQAAAMILLQNDLMVLHAAILEGRRTFRQRHEVHHDGHQLQLRQHVQHGRGHVVPALPADAAAADSAQQPALRRIRNSAAAGPCRRRRPGTTAPLGHGFHPQLHADHRPGQLAVRLSHLLPAAAAVRCATGAVSHRLVRGIDRHPGAGHLRHPDPAQALAEPRQPLARGAVAGRRRRGHGAAVFTACAGSGVRAAAAGILRPAGGLAGGLPGHGRSRKALVLPPARERMRVILGHAP